MTDFADTARRARPMLLAGATTAVVVIGATVASAVLEALVFGDPGPLGLLASAGYVLRHAVAPAVVAVIVARVVARSWRLAEVVGRWTRPDGTAPRLMAWLAWLLIGGLAVAVALLRGTEWLLSLTRAPNTVALSVMAGAVAVVAAVAAATPAAVRGLERLAKRWPATPRRTWWGFAAAAAIVGACVEGLVVRPRVGHLELDFVPFVAAWMVACAAGHRLAARTSRRVAAIAGAATIASAALALACASYAVSQRIDVVLAVWGNVPVGGRAIERSHDLYALRDRIGLTTVAPVAVGQKHPSVVLVTVDTVRADRTPMLGGPAAMPALEKLARVGASFEWALAPSNVTRRSIPALVTGASPFRVRGRVAGWALRLDPRHVLLAERFAAAGYDTAGFGCCESFFAERHRLGWIRGLETVVIERDGRRLASRALEWMARRERDGRPFFVWLHLIEPHDWESDFPARDYAAETRTRRYDRGLTAGDRALAPLLRHLMSDARLDHTLVAVTSDHGEGLGEHGAAYHSTDVYNSQVRVPLVLAGPGVVRGARIRTPVGLVDVAPTLLELAGFRPPGMPAVDGRSFAVLVDDDPLNDDEAPGEAYSVMVRDRSVPRSRWALLAGRHKVIAVDGNPAPDSGDLEVYDVLADPDERTNLAARQPALVERLVERLRARRRVDSIPAF